MGLSKMCKECRECSFKDICNNKRMVSFAAYSEPKSMSNATQLREPIAVKHTPVTINLGNNTKVETSLEEIKKQMEKEFYKNSRLGISCK